MKNKRLVNKVERSRELKREIIIYLKENNFNDSSKMLDDMWKM